ncbi:MutT/nudix family protein [Tripterygium wilfordii]|uniref:MutT/nudix family protein n=1 Tax=Tripterygium wilfordii TaxID=458696 RepID=A0A7J7D4I3_TRIWF|nr:nudix hydrolase 13, mitochondrial-like [Tripterygium wilfordii]KAF5741231.1 MutT/nudix family protein [Tripterygium wilfordii]
MSSSLARSGRHNQRYLDQFRLVAGCIPYKIESNVEDQKCSPESRILVLMVSTPNRNDLVFPKGGWEQDETILEAACREAMEEAGVKGILGEYPLGVWDFRSKSTQNSCSLEGGCRGYMFPLKVDEELDHWPQQATHNRKWLKPEEAFKLCRYDWMRDALRNLLIRLSKDGRVGARGDLDERPIIPVPDTDHHQAVFDSNLVSSTLKNPPPQTVLCRLE